MTSSANSPGALPTTLLRGGAVYNPAEPYATAMLTVGDTVAWIGSEDGADLHVDAADAVIDLGGALVTPAFVDSHVHATSTGLALTGLDLSGAASEAELLDRVTAYARSLPSDAVVLGTGWDETAWSAAVAPNAAELDRAAGGREVYISRVDVHSAAVSSALLAAVPEAADAVGFRASGLVTQEAHHLLRAAAFGRVSEVQRTDAQRAARAHAAELGIGSMHECGGPQISGEADFTGLLELAAAEPGPYVFGYWGELTDPLKAIELGGVGAGGDLFIDGAIGSRTAALRDPYADAVETGDPAHGGVNYLDGEQIAGFLVACAEAGVQPGFHVIGDYAMDLLVGGLALATDAVGEHRVRALTVRAEHAEMADRKVIEKLARHGVVVSAQPGFDAAWGGTEGMYARRLGAGRAAGLNPFAAVSAAGVVLAFGSDSPVTALDPWTVVAAAAAPRNPAYRMTVRAAFAASTRGGWRAAAQSGVGVLAPGASATFAVWDTPGGVQGGLPVLLGDAESPAPERPVCRRTVLHGETIFER